LSGESEKLRRELLEAEARRKTVESMREQASSLEEKLRLTDEALEATKTILKKAEGIIDVLLLKSQDIRKEEMALYRRIFEISPKVIAELKDE